MSTATQAPGTDLLTALEQRLAAAAAVLPEVTVPRSDSPAAHVAALLPALVRLGAQGRPDVLWLLLTAVNGAFPTADQVVGLRRYLELAPIRYAESQILEDAIAHSGTGRIDLPMRVVTADAVVEVDFCARHDTHTGIHRVVRETVPRWTATHDVTPVAWIDEYTAFRTLAPQEENRVLRHGRSSGVDHAAEAAYRPELVVPWGCTVVLPDVPNARASGQLAALGQYSGNRLSMIGYDLIPITSAHLRPDVDSIASATYLTVLKHAHRVAAISASAAQEFTGFVDTLAAQGLTGPRVSHVALTEDAPPPGARTRRSARPVVLLPGTWEPHKNQRAVLHAAERLWREGVDLEVRMVGGRGWSADVLEPLVDRLVAAGRPLVPLGRVPDAQLWQEYRDADLVVFLSLHEGYGLPVAEALACGTPVLTAPFGSQAEIAAAGGCLTADPRDDDAITAALRTLVTDPDARARLAREAAARPRRTWDEYATDLWSTLCNSEEPTA